MSGLLSHPVQRIIQQLLIDDGTLVTDPDEDNLWPVFANSMPDDIHECVEVNDVEGRLFGLEMATLGTLEYPGIQMMTRSNGPSSGFSKAHALLLFLGHQLNVNVTVGDETGTASSDYLVMAIMPSSTVIRLGPESTSHRYRFSSNHLVCLREL